MTDITTPGNNIILKFPQLSRLRKSTEKYCHNRAVQHHDRISVVPIFTKLRAFTWRWGRAASRRLLKGCRRSGKTFFTIGFLAWNCDVPHFNQAADSILRLVIPSSHPVGWLFNDESTAVIKQLLRESLVKLHSNQVIIKELFWKIYLLPVKGLIWRHCFNRVRACTCYHDIMNVKWILQYQHCRCILSDKRHGLMQF